jgi:outer membrane protein OmpA-like peptidoglycan-associated protein
MTRVGFGVGALVLAIGLVARADEPPPPYFALPTMLTVTRTEYRTYQALDLSAVDPKLGIGNTSWVEGKRWAINYAAAGQKPSVIVPALRDKGWEIVKEEPFVVARHHANGHDAWLKGRGGIVELVEKSTARPIDLVPPGETPEPLVKNEAMPYFVPYPGMKVTSWDGDPKQHCDVRNPVLTDIITAGPPAVQMKFTGPPSDVSSLEMQLGYVAAMKRVGWDVVGIATAHYAKHGRDLWLHFATNDGYINICIADVGAAAAANKLKQALDTDGHVAIYGIYFDVDKATLRAEAEAALAQIRDLLKKDSSLKLEVQGHTDNTGSHEHNMTLSTDRSAAVKAWLVAHGIDGARLTTAGYAETKPVGPNTTPEGRQKNRRVELAKK